ncbi:MAG: hypothetical protein JRI30_07200, partial [Deltaproteobacteria bacterium]|nr:hypothetical protein [Deltaproteobacteria bacterium]
MTTGLNENQQKASIAAEKALTRAEKALARSGEALTHAEEAGKLARGKLLFYVTFTDESVHFGFDV